MERLPLHRQRLRRCCHLRMDLRRNQTKFIRKINVFKRVRISNRNHKILINRKLKRKFSPNTGSPSGITKSIAAQQSTRIISATSIRQPFIRKLNVTCQNSKNTNTSYIYRIVSKKCLFLYVCYVFLCLLYDIVSNKCK